MAMGDSGGWTSGGAEGEGFLVRGWDAAKIRVKKTGAGSGGKLERDVGGYGHASGSSRTEQTRMEWRSGREVRV